MKYRDPTRFTTPEEDAWYEELEKRVAVEPRAVEVTPTETWQVEPQIPENGASDDSVS